MPTSRAPSSSGCYQPMSHEAQPLATLHIIGVTVAVLACPCMRAKNTTAALRHKGHKSRTQGHKNTTAADHVALWNISLTQGAVYVALWNQSLRHLIPRLNQVLSPRHQDQPRPQPRSSSEQVLTRDLLAFYVPLQQESKQPAVSFC